MAKPNRRQEILEALALMLETRPGGRITTAALASQLGLSEAALYRHFPSKAKMLEGLIEFAEESLFSRASRIMSETTHGPTRVRQLLFLLLTFVERNPGFARLFVGDALQGETDRLRKRISQMFERLETQLRQILRDHNMTSSTAPGLGSTHCANLLLACAEGRINQFVRTDFRALPTTGWDDQWQVLEKAVFN